MITPEELEQIEKRVTHLSQRDNFLAHARTDVLRLCKEVRDLQEEVVRLESRRGGECSQCGKWVCPPLTCWNCAPPAKDAEAAAIQDIKAEADKLRLENERLKQHVADLNHDLECAVKEQDDNGR